VEDCKAAIRFLRANAEKYGYNADSIAVFGESAGGYLAVMCAVTNDEEFNDLPFIGEDQAGKVSAKVDVLVNYYGAMSFQTMAEELKQLQIPQIVYDIGNYWISEEVLQGYHDLESFWMRKNLSEMTQQEAAVINPYTYINKNLHENSDLSVWIIHGDCDITVPYLQSTQLYNRLTELMGDHKVSYRLVPDMGHASDPLYSDSELALLDQFMKDNLK
jgi:acetyl esterase/lipase